MRQTEVHTPPAPDEVEVSLFGPGVGEGIVVHVGLGEWLVVDSCIGRARRPVALEYLTEIGVNVENAVKLIVVSHWHDDHIQGAAAVVRAARTSRVACSAALLNREFLTMVAASNRSLIGSSGTDEFRKILEIAEEKMASGARAGSAAPVFAKSCVSLMRREGPSDDVRMEVHALSPSDGAMMLSWREIAQNFPEGGRPKRRAIAISPNEAAIVLRVSVGRVVLLLGSDLEESVSHTLGWKAILRLPSRPGAPAQVFKVAHHGSTNADNPEVWAEMLVGQPVAVLTPFATGRRFLPTASDLARLVSRTPHVYCTARPGGSRPTPRSNTVDKIADRVTKTRRALRAAPGHVRVRIGASGNQPAEVHCCGGAFRVVER